MTKSEGKSPLQASGKDHPKVRDDGVGTVTTHGRNGTAESQGGPYPNPHSGKEAKEPIDTFLGHGGQSEIGYHGTGSLGNRKVGDRENPNSATKGK